MSNKIKVRHIADSIEVLAPKNLAEEWDNVGLMVGDPEADVSTVFVCLDVTSDNVAKATELKADLIVSHHPLLFKPLKNVCENDITGSIVTSLIKNGISVYSAHTNLDNAKGGMNDILAEKLDLYEVHPFSDNPNDFTIGRIGQLEAPMELRDFVSYTKSVLNCRTARYLGDDSDTVQTVAVCSGAGGDGIYNAYRAGADVYVTSDIRHHEAQLAFELGINLIDAGHFETENTICEFMTDYLKECFPGLNIIPSDAKPYFK